MLPEAPKLKTEPPHVLVSTTTTIDGFLDDNTSSRLILSSDEDMYEIHRLRARVEAIVIGAETLRMDNPRLDTRFADVQPFSPPVKIVITRSGNINADSRFFTEGSGKKIVFCTTSTPSEKIDHLAGVATIVPCRTEITANTILEYLSATGITKIMVEGGAMIQEMFFAEGCVDILRLGRAPVLLGSSGRPRFLASGKFSPAALTTLSMEKFGSTIVTWYQVKSDTHLLRRAAALRIHSTPNDPAHHGGTIILTRRGEEVTGSEGELFPAQNTAEIALIKAKNLNIDLKGAAVFTSDELSMHTSASLESFCSLLLKSGITRIVMPTRSGVGTEPVHEALKRLETSGILVTFCDISRGNLPLIVSPRVIPSSGFSFRQNRL